MVISVLKRKCRNKNNSSELVVMEREDFMIITEEDKEIQMHFKIKRVILMEECNFIGNRNV